MGRGFVSGFTDQVNPAQTWGCSSPGMPMLYGVWFALAGFSAFTSRLFTAILFLTGVFLITRWFVLRYKPKAEATAAFLLLMIAPSTMVWTLVSCRLEMFALILIAVFMEIQFPVDRAPRYRPLIAPAFGMATVLLGLHFAGFFAVMCCAHFLVQRTKLILINNLFVAAGMVAGALALFIGYKMTGAWDMFVASRIFHYKTSDMFWVPKGFGMYFIQKDGAVLALCGLIVLALVCIGRLKASHRLAGALVGSLAVFLLVPPIINLIGIYYKSYCWMVWVPMVLFLAPHMGPVLTKVRPWALAALTLIILPLYLISALTFAKKYTDMKDQASPAIAQIKRLARPDQAIAMPLSIYYCLKGTHPRLHIKATDWPSETKRAITWVIDTNEAADAMASYIGGRWEEVPKSNAGDKWKVLRRIE